MAIVTSFAINLCPIKKTGGYKDENKELFGSAFGDVHAVDFERMQL